jgi:hypothetical protein
VLRPALLASALTALACGTAPPAFPPSASAAFHDLTQVVRERKRADLWRLVDQRTRDTWQIAWRARRASHELLPLLDREDIGRDPELRALPPAPPARAEDLFTASLSDPDWVHLGEDLDPRAQLIELGTDAQVLSASGERLAFRKAADGSWGFTGFAEPARQSAQRELVLLERIGRLVALATPGLLPGSMPWR